MTKHHFLQGLHYILSETCLALKRKPEYCVYGYTTAAVVRDVDAAEQRFNEYELEERGKFKEETLVSVGSNKIGKASSAERNNTNEFIIVTIIVAADGNYELPPITSGEPVLKGFHMIGKKLE